MLKGWKDSKAFLCYVSILLLMPMVCRYPPPHYMERRDSLPVLCKYPPHYMERLDSLPVLDAIHTHTPKAFIA
jgi:hypothetical protein